MKSICLILIFGASTISNVTVPRPAVLVNVQNIFHLRAGIAVFFVELLISWLSVNSFCSSSGSPVFTVIFFRILEVAEFFVALDLDVRQPRARLHDVGQHHAAVVGLVHRDADVVKLPGGVKRVDVVLGGGGEIDVARLERGCWRGRIAR